MIVASEITLKTLMAQIVEATHRLTNEIGDAHMNSTITEPQLRMAALTAMQIATGEPVWPGDRKIVIRQPRQSFGIFEEERR